MNKEIHPVHQTPWSRLKQSSRFRWIASLLGLLFLVCLLADFLASSAPLTCVYQGERFYPAYQPNERRTFYDARTEKMLPMNFSQVNWHIQSLESAIWAPIPHGSSSLHQTALLPPGARESYRTAKDELKEDRRFRHLLGTSAQGVDIVAGLIHGARISLFVGVFAASLAGLIGILFGSLAAFWGNHRLSIRRGTIILSTVGIFLGWFYGFHVRQYALADASQEGGLSFLFSFIGSLILCFGIVGLLGWIGRRISRKGWLSQTFSLPVDATIVRLVEWMKSLPKLLLIIAIAAIFQDRSIWLVMLIIGLTSWPGIAMLVRGQMKSILPRDYIQSARALGLSDMQIVLKHALPNALPPILVAFSIAIGGAIMAESALSFLQLVDKSPSWGGLISDAHRHVKAWWIAVFPGLMIFLTVLSFNVLAELWRDASAPKED